MSGCPTHGPLVGGYVLGALEAGEMEEMRRHVAACPYCGPEADRLAALPGLLDRIEPADVPPPSLSPEVEEAVLDRFARERREGSARRRRAAWPRLPGRVGPARPARFGRRATALAAAGLVALGLALVLIWRVGGGDGEPAYARATLDGPAGSSQAAATAELGQVPAGTHIWLRARGLRPGAEYEVWCIRADGRWVSGGTFHANREGRSEAELTAAVRAGDYHRMVVTRHPEKGRGSGRGATVLRGELRY